MPLLQRVTKDLVSKGFKRGVVEGNGLWLVVGALALVVRVVSKPEPPKVVTEQLRLGESIVVTHLPPPPSRRKARKERKALKAGEAAGSRKTAGRRKTAGAADTDAGTG